MRNLARIWSLAFILNAVWELLHARLYTVGGQPVLWPRLLQSIFFDAWIVLGMYALFAVMLRDKDWYRRKRFISIGLFILLGAAIAVIVETHAVYIAHRWEYRDVMPTIQGIGLSPLLQMTLLPSLVLMIIRRLPGKNPRVKVV